MDRLFLDANILFSASYRPGAGLLRLWQLKGVELLTSTYALEEARVNASDEEQRHRLDTLMRSVRLVSETEDPLPKGVELRSKDRPILAAAIAVRASHLLTGDKDDFGRYFGRVLGGVLIMTPGQYLDSKSR